MSSSSSISVTLTKGLQTNYQLFFGQSLNVCPPFRPLGSGILWRKYYLYVTGLKMCDLNVHCTNGTLPSLNCPGIETQSFWQIFKNHSFDRSGLIEAKQCLPNLWKYDIKLSSYEYSVCIWIWIVATQN